MGYEQWVVFRIINRDPFHSIVIKDVNTNYGKIHQNDNKDKEIGVSAVEGKEIPVGEEFTFSSCGREWSPSGTDGWFKLYTLKDDLVCRCHWNCPYGSNTNDWTMSDFGKEWLVQSEGASPSGPLGHITIKAGTGA